MKFTVIDLECNQPSGNIIQIGAAIWCTERGFQSSFNVYVDPNEPVNWDHSLNIGCSLEQLLAPGFRTAWEREAVPQKQAMKLFWGWHSEHQGSKKFIQWGRGDLAQLIQESQGCGYPSGIRALDLKQVFQFLWQPAGKMPARSGLQDACLSMRIPRPFPAHDALQDALATGSLFYRMFSEIKELHVLLNNLPPEMF